LRAPRDRDQRERKGALLGAYWAARWAERKAEGEARGLGGLQGGMGGGSSGPSWGLSFSPFLFLFFSFPKLFPNRILKAPIIPNQKKSSKT